MSKNNVHPDHYKVAGRDRQDDAAAARFVRAIAAKTSSRERPDRMTKGPYFQHPEPAAAPERKSGGAAGARSKSEKSKASTTKRPAATRRVASKSASKPASTRRRKSGTRASRPTK
jgi:hypothetical protein